MRFIALDVSVEFLIYRPHPVHMMLKNNMLMLESPKKSVRHSGIGILASAFWHQGQSIMLVTV